MRAGLAGAIASASWACAAFAHAAAPETFVIGNAVLTVTISAKSGAIVAARRVNAAQPYLNPARSAEIVSLEIPINGWDGHAAAGSQAARFKAGARTPQAITLSTAQFTTTEGRFPVAVEIRYRVEGDNVVTQLKLANRGKHRIEQLTFPMLDVEPAADGGESLAMTSGETPLSQLFDANKVRTAHDPFERLDPEDVRGWVYNDPAFMRKAFEYPSGFSLHSAWIHYRAGNSGVGWDIRDRLAQSQHAVIEKKLVRGRRSADENRATYQLSWNWLARIESGQQWQTPEIYLKFDDGDWHPVAKQHREWLKSWLPRPEVAPNLQTSLGWLSRGISSFEQIPGIARTAVGIGAPYFIVYGWYGSGMNGLSYDFYPRMLLGGETSLRENLKKAKALGAYPLAWYNGTTTNEITREHREEGRDWVAVNRFGGYLAEGRWTLFDPDRPPTTDDNSTLMNYDMGSRAAAFNLENVRRMIDDYGFSGFEMDQAGKNYPSYSGKGAARAPELSYTDGVRAVYAGARQIVKAADPQGVVLAEGSSDFMNPYMDSSWTFDGSLASTQMMTFHRYALPWVTLPAGVFTPDVDYVNQAFLMNAPLDIFLDVGAYPEFVDHLQKIRRLKQAVHTYLYDGDFSDVDGFALHAPAGSTLIARSYIEDGKATAVVVVNSSAVEQTATLDIDGAGVATLYGLDGATSKATATTGIALRLAAHDITVVTVTRGQTP